MKIELKKTSRLPQWSIAIVACGVAYLATVASIELFVENPHDGLVLCPFKRLTSLPCPTCGATRSVLSLLSGDLATAFLYNPMVFVVGGLLVSTVVIHITAARRISLGLTTIQRRLCWAIVAACTIANWAYVINRGL